jgi:preprotein translocase subunit SecG
VFDFADYRIGHFNSILIILEEAMHTALMIILLLASIVLIVSILLQTGNSDGLSGSIAGGAEQLFGKRKSRGYDALLAKITTVAAIVYIIVSLAIVAIFN